MSAADLEDHSEDLPSNNSFLAFYIGISGLAAVLGTCLHPILLRLTISLWGLGDSDEVDTNVESSFFQLLSIVYGLFAGQTFLFLYERQVNLAQELYGEVYALELLMQQTFASCKDYGLRIRMAYSAREYIKSELYNPTDMESPFSKGSSFMIILGVVEQMKMEGMAVSGLVEAGRQLADAQSKRSAMAAQILPLVHWVFMHAMELIFVGTFLLFDAAELSSKLSTGVAPDVPEERSLLFGTLLALLTLTSQVLHDISDPFSGMYNIKGAVDARMTLLMRLLALLEQGDSSYVPSTVRTLTNLGLIPSSLPDQGPGATTPKMGKGQKGRRTRTMKMPWRARETNNVTAG